MWQVRQTADPHDRQCDLPFIKFVPVYFLNEHPHFEQDIVITIINIIVVVVVFSHHANVIGGLLLI